MNDLEIISWILRGSQRRVIFKVIKGKMIPAQIYVYAKNFNPKITRNNVSDILRELRDKKLAMCINPDETKGRIYELTKKGIKIQEKIENYQKTTN